LLTLDKALKAQPQRKTRRSELGGPWLTFFSAIVQATAAAWPREQY
jgi:hypothetical protein